MSTFQQAREAWNAHSGLRTRRSRYKDYTYGRQWGDPVSHQGRMMTEGELAELSGKKPMTNNLIRQLVKSVVGRFRHLMTQEHGHRDIDPEVVGRNMLDELDCRLLEEFLISGCAIQRLTDERRPGGAGVWVDNVSPDNFFCNRFTDPRGNDLELVGQLHDMSLREVQMRFADGDRTKAERLAHIYRDAVTPHWVLPAGRDYDPAWSRAAPGRCRVIEVWTLECRSLLKCRDAATGEAFTISPEEQPQLEALNTRREAAALPGVAHRRADLLRWHCRYYAPGGELLHEHDSPWPHGSHPYAVKLYPLIDGEVHSFVEDVIDQQRYINRLITLIDHIMSVSAKGVLLFPESQKPSDMSRQDVADRWANPNGLLPYKPDHTSHIPTQVVTGTPQANAYELLNLELNLIRQVSGVNGALAGQSAAVHSSAALYEAESNNATIALLDIFESFKAFRAARDKKLALVGNIPIA